MSELDDSEASKNKLLALAAFGDEIDSFLCSNVGRYMLQCAQAEVDIAFKEFRECDATDARAVQALQNKIFVGESIQNWLRQAVASGLHAMTILEDRSNERDE